MPERAKIIAEALVPYVALGALFGLLYNTLFYPWTLVEYLEAGTIGVLLGAITGFAEQTVLKGWLQRRSLLQAIVARTVAYSLVVALVLSLVLSIEPASLGDRSYTERLAEYVRGPLFLRDLVFTTLFVFFIGFAAQVVFLVGTRNFVRLIIGRYRKPREVRAAFMFVDLRGSTTIAEALGHERFSAFLRDFFNDISGPIHRASGEVYLYIGDEVVIVWRSERSSDHWLTCFNYMRAAIVAKRAVYEAKYGVVPVFKAGVHLGDVVATEVGTLQRALHYHGDVLNTAARIQGKCNEAGFDLLVSEAAMRSVGRDKREGFEEIGELPLQGKSEAIMVFGFARSSEDQPDISTLTANA